MSRLFFNDLEKPLIDILNEEYFFSKKLFVKSRTVSGLEWSTEGDFSSRGTSGSMALSYKDPSGFHLEKIRLKTDGRVLAQVSCEATDELKFIACIEDGRVEPGKPLHSFGKLGMDYCYQDRFSAQADLDIVNGPSIQGSLFSQLRFLRFGGEFMCNTHLEDKNSKPELVDLNIGGAIVGSDWFASIRTTNLFSNIRVGYTCLISKTMNFGALVNYRVFQNQQSVLIGAVWSPDVHTQIRGRIDSAAIFGVSLHQRLTNYLKLTLCAEVDTREFGLDGHKFGFSLTFE